MTPSKRSNNDTQSSVELKKLNTTFNKEDIHSFFNQQIWDTKFQDDLKTTITESQPYRWGTIKGLMDDTLLRQVRKKYYQKLPSRKRRLIFIKFSNWVIWPIYWD